MIEEFVFNNRKYWINIKSAVDRIRKEKGFLAYVSDKETNWADHGRVVKDDEGNSLFFKDISTARRSAQAYLMS